MTTITTTPSRQLTASTNELVASVNTFKTRFNTSRKFRTTLAVIFGVIIVIALYTPAILSGQF